MTIITLALKYIPLLVHYLVQENVVWDKTRRFHGCVPNCISNTLWYSCTVNSVTLKLGVCVCVSQE